MPQAGAECKINLDGKSLNHPYHRPDMSLFATPTKLQRLQIEITTGCNLRCAGCQRTIGMNRGDWRNQHMAPDLFAKILGNAPPAEALVLQGIGEPTLHPRLDELLALAKASAKYPLIGFNSNALAHEPQAYAAWKEAGLTHLAISVDSFDPVLAEKSRAGTDVAALRRAIPELLALFGSRVTFSVVVSKANLPGLGALLEELAQLGAQAVEVQPLVGYGPESEPLALSRQDREAVIQIAAAVRNRRPGLAVMLAAILTPNGSRCRRPFHAGYVTVEGYLTPCCLTQDVALYGRASLAEQSFAEAWTSPGVAGWLESTLDGTPEICRGCCNNPAGEDLATAKDRRQLLHFAATTEQKDQAEAGLRRLLAEGTTPEALHRLGLLALEKGQAQEAVTWLETAARLDPSPAAVTNLAAALTRAGQPDRAIGLLSHLLNRQGDNEPATRSLVGLLLGQNRRKEAADVLHRLIRRAIDANNRPLVERHLGNWAQLCDDQGLLLMVANLLRGTGWAELAAQLAEAILARWPGHLGARLTACMAMLPQGYQSAAQMAEIRAGYGAALTALAEDAEAASPQELARALPQLGQAKPFYLSYQGENDRDLQMLYGRVVGAIARATEMPRPPLVTSLAPGEKLRIGFATSHFRLHSVSKLFGGWIKRMDRSRFALYGYDLAERPAQATSDYAPDPWAREHLDSFDGLTGGLTGDEAWISAIAGDRLHAMIYFELGMDPMAVRLACRRLAPVQCQTWGHPVTSGLETIDYFLTSELMEPPEGDAHYTERLVRLPNLSVFYQPLPQGQGIPPGRLNRAGLGLREDALVFVCCQSLFKYRPQEDQLFVRIAQALPQAQFLFIGQSGLARTETFRARLAAAFGEVGLSFQRQVVFTEPVPGDLFPSLLELGDVYLDSAVWSGGNTSLEAATAGLPIITLEGTLMRGRHTAAILRHMGLSEWIAKDADQLVGLAVRLADPDIRAAAAAQMAERRSWLFGDETPVRALEDFLLRTVRSIMDPS